MKENLELAQFTPPLGHLDPSSTAVASRVAWCSGGGTGGVQEQHDVGRALRRGGCSMLKTAAQGSVAKSAARVRRGCGARHNGATVIRAPL